jgi:hypothetical protein
MLRISEIKTDQSVTLKLEGRLLGDWIDELESAYCRAATVTSVQLDLHGLIFADDAGSQRSAG